jgi:hypothetical protein
MAKKLKPKYKIGDVVWVRIISNCTEYFVKDNFKKIFGEEENILYHGPAIIVDVLDTNKVGTQITGLTGGYFDRKFKVVRYKVRTMSNITYKKYFTPSEGMILGKCGDGRKKIYDFDIL